MKIKTSELEGAALDWAVAHAVGIKGPITWEWNNCRQGFLITYHNRQHGFSPSTAWIEGGPLLDRFRISVYASVDPATERLSHWVGVDERSASWARRGVLGPTPLIAAMRAIVAAELGDTVDVPEELA